MKIHMQKKYFVSLFVALFTFGFFLPPAVDAAQKPVKVQRPKNHIIKVLLAEAPGETVFASDGRYIVETYDQEQLHLFEAGEQAKMLYDNGDYVVKFGPNFSKEKRSTKPIKVTPVKRGSLVEIVNFLNPNSWEETDNLFYNSIKLEMSPRAGTPVLVNEIGVERYTEGLCESGGQERTAYLNALMVAARTYATYHSIHKTKYPGEPYEIDATARSQIYCGAEFTQREPQVREARKATKKHLVFYNNEIVITPYFSHSDGRTRAWSEVWGGSGYDYLKSVKDPCCTSMTMSGGNHGVGLSGEGARYWSDHGKGWKWILKYYYSGTEIREFTKKDFTE